MKKAPFDVVKSQYVTEKATVLQGLQSAESNPSLAKCDKPKYVFLVDRKANKVEVRQAIEEIYKEKKIHVTKVNIINTKPKKKRTRGRYSYGTKSGYKKAIVTLESGDVIE